MTSTDTLIIGSGVAATAVSHRLLEKDPKAEILILEAGTKVTLKDYGIWENYVVTGRLPYDPFKDQLYPDRDHPGENMSAGGMEIPLRDSRVFTFGGSTIHWGGWSFRLKPEDFKLHSRTKTLSEPGKSIDWQIEYRDIEKHYCEAEHYLGVSGDSHDNLLERTRAYPYPAFPYTLEDKPIADALDILEFSYGNLPIARHGITDTTSRHAPCQTTGTCKYCPFGARYAATNYLEDMLKWSDFPNFRVITNAIVQEIVMNTKAVATGVEYLDKSSGNIEFVSANTIIVAAGAIESAKLLQRSKSRNWIDGIGNDTGNVGRNLITHPYFMITGKTKSNPLKLQPEMNFPTLCSRHFDSEVEQNKGKYILVNPAESTKVAIAKQMVAGMTRDDIDSNLLKDQKIQIDGMVEIFSNSENYVENSNKLNKLGLYETNVRYTADDGFDKRMDDIVGSVTKIFEKMKASYVGRSISWRADHASCTCRMSADEQHGVVDKNLKIHGTENLFVCSNAVFASSGAVNPTLTLTALALRLGDHLSDLRKTIDSDKEISVTS